MTESNGGPSSPGPFQDFPLTFSDDEISRALPIAEQTEQSGDASLHELGRTLLSRGTEVREEDNQAGLLVIVDGLVCQLFLGDVAHEHWGGIPLGPMMEMGGGAFPPYVPSFPQSVLSYVERRAADTTREGLRARYHDFLWCRRRSYRDAQGAIRAYRSAGIGSDPKDATDHMTAARYLARAAELSLALNFERRETAAVLLAEIQGAIGEEGGGFVWQVAHALGPLAQDDPDFATGVIDRLFEEAERSRGDAHHEKTTLEAAEALGNVLDRRDAVDRARREFAEACEREAAARAGEGGLIQVALLRDAIEAYQRIGDGAAIQRMKDRLGEAAIQAESELHPIGVEVKVPTEMIEKARDEAVRRIESSDEGLLGVPAALGIWPRWSIVRERYAKSRQEHPLQWLGSRFTLGTEGRVSSPPQTEAEREEAYLLDFFSQEFQMTVGLSIHLVDLLRSGGHWSADALIASIQEADSELAAAAEPGIRSYETGDTWSAAHVLIPQFERGLRQIALQLSANVRRLVQDQGLQMATLGPILADATVKRFLGEDVAPSFEAVFVEPRGLNVRNNTAHGLLDPTEDQRAVAFIALMGVLTAAHGLLYLRSAELRAAESDGADQTASGAADPADSADV